MNLFFWQLLFWGRKLCCDQNHYTPVLVDLKCQLSNEILCGIFFAHAKEMCFCYCTEYAIQTNGYKKIGSSKDAETAS